MPTEELLIAAFALLIGGLLLPLPHGARMTLILALIALGVMSFVGGGIQYLMSLTQ